MKSMIHAIWIWCKGSAVIANASGRSFIIAANAISNSMRGLTLTEMTVTPNVRAAACTSSNWRTLEALSGFQRKATRETVGIASLRTCSRLAPTSGPRMVLPVTFAMTAEPFHQTHIAWIMDFLAKNRLPAAYQLSENARAGGLMSYGASEPDLFRRAAGYVHRILLGTKPADLPVEQPVKFELAG